MPAYADLQVHGFLWAVTDRGQTRLNVLDVRFRGFGLLHMNTLERQY